MQAIICTKYGLPEVLELQEVTKPTPKDTEVLIKIHATTVSTGDARIRSLNIPTLFKVPFRLMLGWTKPRKPILGCSFSGVIENIGKDVTRFKKGDQVFGATEFDFGTYAQYKCLSEKAAIVIKPQAIPHEIATCIPFGGSTALHFLRKARIKKGQKILIFGASGALGTAAIQLAKHFGAKVTGVCSSSNVKLVKSLGADTVIDYTKEDSSKNNETYEVIFDTVGKSPFSWCVKALTKTGVYLRAVHMDVRPLLQGMWTEKTSNKKVVGGVVTETQEDLEYLKGLVLKGIFKPVIDKTYPLSQTADAHRYVDTGHKKGNVVITVRKDKKN